MSFSSGTRIYMCNRQNVDIISWLTFLDSDLNPMSIFLVWVLGEGEFHKKNMRANISVLNFELYTWSCFNTVYTECI